MVYFDAKDAILSLFLVIATLCVSSDLCVFQRSASRYADALKALVNDDVLNY